MNYKFFKGKKEKAIVRIRLLFVTNLIHYAKDEMSCKVARHNKVQQSGTRSHFW